LPSDAPLGDGSATSAAGTACAMPGVVVGVAVATDPPVGVRVAVEVGVRVRVELGVSVNVAVRVGVRVCVNVGVRVNVRVGVLVDVGVRVRVDVWVRVAVRVLVGLAIEYWKTFAQLDIVQAVQDAQVPLLAKIWMSVPVVFQASMMYLTVVPPGCAGIVALTTSTVCGDPVERSTYVQPYTAVSVCDVPPAMPRAPLGVEPSVV
jgi:hypothetical protein